jgi:hypothetical protein
MDNYYIPYFISLVLIFSILILWAILYYIPNTSSTENFGDSVTKIMETIPDVPTIKLIEKSPKKNILQKILGNVNNTKIPFNIIKTISGDYNLSVPSYEDFNFSGKGLVIAASGNRYRYLTGLYANLYCIRKYHKSNIPVEIFYVGKSEEFNYKIKNLILSLGNITIYNLLDRINTTSTEEELRGYQTKPLSVLCSSFEEVILLDADALCFIDPQYLFLAEGYESSGMLLFKDYVDCMSFISRDFIETIGIGVDKYCDYTGDFEIDSSCVVMNKSKCWDALYTICIINVKSDNYHKSKNVLGDKDTFIIGSMFVDFYPFVSKPPPRVFVTSQNKVVVGHLQSTLFDGQEIFTHYNNQKISLSDSDINDYTYSEVKNPKSGQENYYGLPLTEKIINSFKYAKEGMALLEPHIPSYLKDKVQFVNGVSKGLIP